MTIQEFANKAIRQGVRFKQHGNDFDGWDCWGLIVVAYKEIFDVELPHYNEEYNTIKDKNRLFELFHKGAREMFVEIEKERIEPGDVAILLLEGVPIHIGLLIDKNRILHIEFGIDTCIQPLKEFRVEGFYRYAEFS